MEFGFCTKGLFLALLVGLYRDNRAYLSDVFIFRYVYNLEGVRDFLQDYNVYGVALFVGEFDMFGSYGEVFRVKVIYTNF